ncbi:lipopolysaccharide assembly protein LapB [Methylophaga sp.]|uniref:lipopolysaccharide assembly protein LapB n=1 Tax=Methylophaga sp. TaxID=2024840 RepID=UPI003A8E3535
MMQWLFLLLPVAALSGWLLAKRHYLHLPQKHAKAFNPEYFKGLNYLLNEQPDKAIDVFIGLLEVNSETVETHLALANLFRRRGETERAIRIHQNLIARPSLHGEQRLQAMVELGLDYMHAGVLDRAEHLFLELLQQPHPHHEAAKQLMRIYQQEKKWAQAIEMGKQIEASKTGQAVKTLIAQFYCELAEIYANKDRHEAFNLLKNALFHDPNCVRASLLEAKLYLILKQPRKALDALQNIEQQNPKFLSEALPHWHEAYQQLGDIPTLRERLSQLVIRHPNMTSARIMLTHIVAQLESTKAAQQVLYEQLHHHPSVEGLHTLIKLGENNQIALIPLIERITRTMVEKGDRYTCKNCGFSGKTMHWLCPGCASWGTVRPTEIHLTALEKLLDSPS